MKYRFDLDGTLCRTEGMDYESAEPIWQHIDRVNVLFDAGHHITIATARGAESGKPWRELAERQLSRWRVKYHDLRQKPFAHIIVDDRAMRPEEFFDAEAM